jgi:cell division protein FtsZ
MLPTDDPHAIPGARLAVVGVGGGGSNVVDAMIAAGLGGVDFVAVNTDAQALHGSRAPRRFQLGRELTRGLGAGANPEVGRGAALADREQLAELVRGVDMVFVTVGLGGGTGTGAAPVVAEVCREAGALVVGVATLPFGFEGRRRARVASDGVERLREQVDTLLTIPNDRLLALVDDRTPMHAAFGLVDDLIVRGVGAVAGLVQGNGRINVDFADIRTIMGQRGRAILGVGLGRGTHRCVDAAEAAYHAPLLQDVALTGARHILLNVRGPEDLTLREVSEAATFVGEEADPEVNLIWGWMIDPSFGDQVEVTLIATGFDAPPPTTRSSWRRADPRRAAALDDDAYDVPSFFRTGE